MKKRILFCALITVSAVCHQAQAQTQDQFQLPRAAVKTNLLYGAGTLTPNLGVEFGLGRKITLNVAGGYNPWNLKGSDEDNKKLVHWLVQPELRYWTRERFGGHFFGIHALGGLYNISGHDIPLLFDQAFRYEGYALGGGVSYGYAWNWNHRWGMEFTVGVGAVYMDYDKYDCVKCGDKLGTFNKTFFGPTKAGITLVYMMGGKRKQSDPAPVYTPPVVAVAPIPEPVPEPVVPVAVPELIPQPTTAEKLSIKMAFVTPVEVYQEYAEDKTKYVNDNRKETLAIFFTQGGKTIDLSYKDNRRSFESLIETINEIQASADSRVAKVVVAGFASPEGTAAINDRLATERADIAKRFLAENSMLMSNQVEVYNGQVDWHRLRQMVEDSDMPSKEQVLHILDYTPVWDAARKIGKLGELMRLNGGVPYRYMLKNFFPDLRNATYIKVYFENK